MEARKSDHLPIRQCVGCRQRMEKRRLVRFVRGDDGWSADPDQTAPGRGAYLCSPECLIHTKKNKKYKGLSLVSIPNAVFNVGFDRRSMSEPNEGRL